MKQQTPLTLTASRIETFSDGVIAVIITVMVLDLRVPVRRVPDVEAMREVLPILVVYALSFVEVGIYWVNHHYLLEKVSQVSYGLLWGNLGFLFTLSLIPFGTAWVGERGISPFGLAVYLMCCATPAVSWIALSAVVRRYVPALTDGKPVKQAVSLAIYLGVIPVLLLAEDLDSYARCRCSAMADSAKAGMWIEDVAGS